MYIYIFYQMCGLEWKIMWIIIYVDMSSRSEGWDATGPSESNLLQEASPRACTDITILQKLLLLQHNKTLLRRDRHDYENSLFYIGIKSIIKKLINTELLINITINNTHDGNNNYITYILYIIMPIKKKTDIELLISFSHLLAYQ